MSSNQMDTPLFDALIKHKNQKHKSFHVPGHKNGSVFNDKGKEIFQSILPIDLTEITGLDDLHYPSGVIAEAQKLASDLYGSEKTFFLVNGSTSGNLAMILGTCQKGDYVLVQRNSHKSIMHGLELTGTKPIFITPSYNRVEDRFELFDIKKIKQAFKKYPIKAMILTYPDYFGQTFNLEELIECAHNNNIPVLVDEAHGAHFILDYPLPNSSLSLGADIVVQSAHKMLPAMTMGSFLHINSNIVNNENIKYYLQMLQSSSPSYPIMASLDLARHYLASFSKLSLNKTLHSVAKIRELFEGSNYWSVQPIRKGIDDPLKITLRIDENISGFEVAKLFEEKGIFPELVMPNKILLIHGLEPAEEIDSLKNKIKQLDPKLKRLEKHDKIDIGLMQFPTVHPHPYSLSEINDFRKEWVTWEQAEGRISAFSVIPYPPGVPLILKGEEILKEHIESMHHLIQLKAHVQYQMDNITKGLYVIKES